MSLSSKSFFRAAATVALTVATTGAGAAVAQAARKTSTTKTSSAHFTYLGTHPQAAAQPTALGRTIQTLRGWDGQIYAGYGDYGANTGPIAITPFDPSAQSFSATPALVDQTESIDQYRTINGDLYAPSTDPRGATSTDWALGTPIPLAWSQSGPVGATHVYDMFTYTGSDLWAIGSVNDSDAAAWRSLDGGASWQLVLDVPPTAICPTGTDARFMMGGAYNGSVYLEAYGFCGTYYSFVYDGTSWTHGPWLGGYGYHTENFAGQLVYQSQPWYVVASTKGAGGYLMSFNGSQVTSLKSVYDYAVDGSTLYALDTSDYVWATNDLKTWKKLTSAPSTARSITAYQGMIYVGTTDSKLYGYPYAGAA